jgi:hypothetical protein
VATKMGAAKPAGHWSIALCHPIPLSCVLVLAINDHWLKGSGFFPSWLTGKISDLAGLFFFPALLVTLYLGCLTLVRRSPSFPKWLVAVSVLITGLVFSAVNCWPAFNDLLASISIFKVMDPSDLFALPVLGFAWLWLESRRAEAT